MAASTPRWLKKLRIGIIVGLLLGVTGFMMSAPWLTWGLLYAPMLSLTHKGFWHGVARVLAAKDKSSSSSYINNDSSRTGYAYNSQGELVVDTDPDTYHGPNW